MIFCENDDKNNFQKNFNDGIKSYQKALDIGREHCDNVNLNQG